MKDLLVVAGASFAIAALAMAVTAVVARRIGRVSVVDVTWGLALTGIALACAALGSGWVPWLLAGLVAVWGCRLSWHMYRRQRGHGEDPRYTALLGGLTVDDGSAWFAAAVRKVFVIQGAAVFFVAWPLLSAAVGTDPVLGLVWVGAALWLVGFVFETVGDAQLAAYKADPDRGPVMDRGLWGWTRHPNYFGDACVWWGIWLAGAAAYGWLPALVTVAAPIAMTYFLAYATGRPAAGADHDAAARLPGVRRAHLDVRAAPAEEAPGWLTRRHGRRRGRVPGLSAHRLPAAQPAADGRLSTARSTIGHGQTNSQPRTVEAMLRLLDVRPGQRVLDVGSGSGWSTALLAHLTGDTGEVLGVEIERDLVDFGAANLAATHQSWASIRAAEPGVLGLPDHAPYDRILVSAEPRTLPDELVQQLGDGGRMVIPVNGTMLLVTRTGEDVEVTQHGGYRFVPLR